MKRATVTAALLAFLGAANTARAEDANVKTRVIQEADKTVYRKKSVVDFSEVNVEGDLTKPEGSYVINRRKSGFDSRIRLRQTSRRSFRSRWITCRTGSAERGRDGDGAGGGTEKHGFGRNESHQVENHRADGRVSESVSDQESIILGSGSGAAVQIPDPHVSNLHLMLKRERNGAVKVIDLGSERGTHVAGSPVLEPRSLASGDVISVGRSRVEVLFGGGTPATAAPRGAFAELELVAPNRHQGGAMPALQLDAPPRRLRPPEAPAARARPGVTRLPAEPPTPAHHALQVALVWGDRILDVKHFADGAPVRIGDSPRNDFQVFSAAIGKSFRFAVAEGGKVSLTLPPQTPVTVSKNGQARRAAGAAAVTLGLDEQARVEIENVALLVRQVRPPPGIALHRGERTDFTFLKITGISLLAGAALVVALLITPREERSSDELFHSSANRVVHYLARPVVIPKPVKVKQEKKLAEGEKASGEEGKFGKPDAKKEQADPSKPGQPDRGQDQARAGPPDHPARGPAGGGGAAGRQGRRVQRAGAGGFGTGINDSLGGLKAGAGMGDARGFGGLGERGTGPGAGGTGLGLGGLGTKGKGRGGPGGGVDLGGLQKEVVKVVPGQDHHRGRPLQGGHLQGGEVPRAGDPVLLRAGAERAAGSWPARWRRCGPSARTGTSPRPRSPRPPWPPSAPSSAC